MTLKQKILSVFELVRGLIGKRAARTELAAEFSAYEKYDVGRLVVYEDELYRCVTKHTGIWNKSDFEKATVDSALQLKGSGGGITEIPNPLELANESGDGKASMDPDSGFTAAFTRDTGEQDYAKLTPYGVTAVYQDISSEAKMSSADGFSHVVPKTLDGTAFSDVATVSAGGVKLTSHELEEYNKEVSVEVVSESAPSSMFFRRCAVNAVGTGITGFPYAEGTDGTGGPEALFNVTPTRFTLGVSGLFHNDGWSVVDDRGHEDALVRAVYNATGAMFIQPDVDGHKDNLDKPYVRRNEVTADGVYLVKPNYTYETSSLLTKWLLDAYEDVDRFVASRDSDSINTGNNTLDPYFYYKDRHGMPTMLHDFQDGHDYANLTAARLLFRRDDMDGLRDSEAAVFGGMSAEMVKFYGDPDSGLTSGTGIDELQHSSALSSQWLRIQRYDDDANEEGNGGYVYSRVEADGLTIGNSVSGRLRTTVKMGEMRLTEEGDLASLTPTELKLYTDVNKATATMTPTELKLYLLGCDTPYIAVGTEEAGDRTYAESTGLDGGYQAFIRAPGGLMLRIGSSGLYLTEEKLNTLSSVLDDYSALQEKVEALEKALAGAVSATVSGDEKTLTLGTITTSTETKSDAAETTAGA